MTGKLATVLLLGTCGAGLTLAMPNEARAEQAGVAFNISRGDLKSALQQFIQATGEQLVYRSGDIARVSSPGVSGVMESDAALRRILAGTGFVAKRDASGAIAIVAEPAARHQATPAAPRPEPELMNSSSQPGSTYIGANEILVTARKKGESDLDVPIAIKALGAVQLNRNAIQNLSDVAAITPSLNITQSPANSGGTITLRGIGSPSTAAGNDQAVSINLDGITISDGMAVNFAQFDLERVEVLQGPQSLYYGKNSSAGIVSVVSADPTEI
ncbi:MAG: TonB-dependent receptor plug domain-containing protein [Novosphingobium sp.]